MIDMHAHWRPAELADALRSRTTEPRIVKGADGAEVLKSRMGGDEPLAEAFDDPQFHLAKMERLGVGTSVLSLLGSYCWIESQPVETATTLRVENGQMLLTDGPFIDAKEHVGGFALVEADDLDAALELAARIPTARLGGFLWSRCLPRVSQ